MYIQAFLVHDLNHRADSAALELWLGSSGKGAVAQEECAVIDPVSTGAQSAVSFCRCMAGSCGLSWPPSVMLTFARPL